MNKRPSAGATVWKSSTSFSHPHPCRPPRHHLPTRHPQLSDPHLYYQTHQEVRLPFPYNLKFRSINASGLVRIILVHFFSYCTQVHRL
jgi:hypothetical protein